MTELIEFIENNQEKFYRVAYAYVKHQEDALDIVHDTIVKALQKHHTLREPKYMRMWFYRILINESISFLRKNKKVLSFEELTDSQIPATEGSESGEYLDLYDALDRLPIKLKTVILLRFFEDMKIEEVAKITKSNLSTTKSRIYKALKLLKADMEVK